MKTLHVMVLLLLRVCCFSCRIYAEWLLACWPSTPALMQFPTTRSSRVSRNSSWQLKLTRHLEWRCHLMTSWVSSATSLGPDTAAPAASFLMHRSLAVQQNQTLADHDLVPENSTAKSTNGSAVLVWNWASWTLQSLNQHKSILRGILHKWQI